VVFSVLYAKIQEQSLYVTHVKVVIISCECVSEIHLTPKAVLYITTRVMSALALQEDDARIPTDDIPLSLRLLSEKLKKNMPLNPLETMPVLTSAQ